MIELREPGSSPQALCWLLLLLLLLLTCLPIFCHGAARWYALRWENDVFDRVLKTGRHVDTGQLRGIDRLRPMTGSD